MLLGSIHAPTTGSVYTRAMNVDEANYMTIEIPDCDELRPHAWTEFAARYSRAKIAIRNQGRAGNKT
jgi:hypothetical protein